MSLNKEILDDVNQFSIEYKNLIDIIEVQSLVSKYKKKYEKLNNRFKKYKELEDKYEENISKRKKKVLKYLIKSL